ncbi:TetR/AcrR family transcriptional regulator [Chondromyces apiculatus]|uniref:Transcriptional regulator, TetR family n=1 Tax=Chondromyces apiculatus DSM 436 TaxID=1192034 RepID=A0A017TAX4_9BACT|nr:TetR/AcrR family transcriptional regulator [Chondromyces apiculatus]EYF05771.1 Transcriptional regulator, TetR family [Chondromyces apiculatus DSM 436]
MSATKKQAGGGVAAPAQRLRADAQRNRERLLAAADEAFAENGAEASLDDVARRAGVGIGTLYRHFPTREALLVATAEDRLAALGKKGRALLGTASPGEELEAWLRAMVKHTTTYQGLAGLLAGVVQGLSVGCDDVKKAGCELLTRAQAAGEIRADVSFEDVLGVVTAIAFAAQQSPTDKGRARRLLVLFLEGLRVPGARQRAAQESEP